MLWACVWLSVVLRVLLKALAGLVYRQCVTVIIFFLHRCPSSPCHQVSKPVCSWAPWKYRKRSKAVAVKKTVSYSFFWWWVSAGSINPVFHARIPLYLMTVLTSALNPAFQAVFKACRSTKPVPSHFSISASWTLLRQVSMSESTLCMQEDTVVRDMTKPDWSGLFFLFKSCYMESCFRYYFSELQKS